VATTVDRPGTMTLHFPFGGVDRSDAFCKQEPREVLKGFWGRTTSSAMNVRNYDVQDRLRGGSRPGLSKKFSDRPADFIVQHIACMVVEGTPVQFSNSGRVVYVIEVAQGNVYYRPMGDDSWTAATNSSGGTPPLNFTGIMQSSACVQKLWFADGTNYVFFDPETGVVDDWVASAGTLPKDADNNFPRLICTWRGRIITSGLLKRGQAVYGAAVDNPLDYDEAPAIPTATMAWSFTTGKEGQIGDTVTGLCPFTDDVLIVFCSGSILIVRGDPADGGKRDFITDEIGAAWGKAWCRTPEGNIYFVSNKLGIYIMRPNSLPQRISQPIEQLVAAKNTGDLQILLEYDEAGQCIHIFYSPIDDPQDAEHLTYELRTNAWQPLKFANNNHNPLAVCTFDGNEVGDRVMAMGGWDGYTRYFDPDAEDDDGTPIDSWVLIGPLLTANADEVMIHDLQAILGDESGDVFYDVLDASTAESLATASEDTDFWSTVKAADHEGTFEAGRNYTHPARHSGHALGVRLASRKRWSMEQIRCTMSTRGLVRGRAP
jgi:hypothetical protein